MPCSRARMKHPESSHLEKLSSWGDICETQVCHSSTPGKRYSLRSLLSCDSLSMDAPSLHRVWVLGHDLWGLDGLASSGVSKLYSSVTLQLSGRCSEASWVFLHDKLDRGRKWMKDNLPNVTSLLLWCVGCMMGEHWHFRQSNSKAQVACSGSKVSQLRHLAGSFKSSEAGGKFITNWFPEVKDSESLYASVPQTVVRTH